MPTPSKAAIDAIQAKYTQDSLTKMNAARIDTLFKEILGWMDGISKVTCIQSRADNAGGWIIGDPPRWGLHLSPWSGSRGLTLSLSSSRGSVDQTCRPFGNGIVMQTANQDPSANDKPATIENIESWFCEQLATVP